MIPLHAHDAPAYGSSAGELQWGVKSGFRSYIAELPDGSVDASEGSRVLDDGQFAFPVTRVGGSDPITVELGGSVTFRGHGAMLHVQLRDLVLELDGDDVHVRAAGPVDHPRITIAQGRSSVVGAAQWDIAVRLAPEGVALFDGNYPVGVALDDMHLVLPDLPGEVLT